MKVLFCGGSPKAGSWQMRGVQMAQFNFAWKAISHPSLKEIAESDIVVVVKRFNPDLVAAIRAAKKPLVLDALDFWPQIPNARLPQKKEEATIYAKAHIDLIKPDAIVCATHAMAYDFQGLAKNIAVIYHHFRLTADPCPGGGSVVYYDGSEKHIRSIAGALERICRQAGLEFAIGEPQKDALALIGVRDDGAASFLNRRWKSNVKAANALAYNLPFISQRECGVTETMPNSAVHYFDRLDELQAILLGLRYSQNTHDFSMLRQSYERMRIASAYNAFLEAVVCDAT